MLICILQEQHSSPLVQYLLVMGICCRPRISDKMEPATQSSDGCHDSLASPPEAGLQGELVKPAARCRPGQDDIRPVPTGARGQSRAQRRRGRADFLKSEVER